MNTRFLIPALSAFTICLAHSPARADLVELASLAPGASTFSFFVVKDARKITPQRAVADLTRLLAPLNRLPCMVATDRGAFINCDAAGVAITSTHAYSYNLQLSFPNALSELKALDPKVYKGVKFPDGTGQAWGVNFLPPPTDGVTPCTGACNQVGPITLAFATPIKQFGITIDAGDAIQLLDQLIVTINGHTVTRNLALGLNDLRFEDIDPNTGASTAITSVTLEPVGGQSQAFVFDRIAYTK